MNVRALALVTILCCTLLASIAMLSAAPDPATLPAVESPRGKINFSLAQGQPFRWIWFEGELVPRRGDIVNLGGQRYTVIDVHWEYSDAQTGPAFPAGAGLDFTSVKVVCRPLN